MMLGFSKFSLYGLSLFFLFSFCSLFSDDTTPDNPNWTKVVVDPSAKTGKYSSIAVANTGNAVISYYDESNQRLKIATESSGAFSLVTVNATEDSGLFTNITLDATGTPFVAHLAKISFNFAIDGSDATTVEVYTVNLASDFMGSMQNTPVPVNVNTNVSLEVLLPVLGAIKSEITHYPSIGLSSTGIINISYMDNLGGSLEYLRIDPSLLISNPAAAFFLLTVDGDSSDTTMGHYSDIKVDTLNQLHIAYYDGDNGHLKYAFSSNGGNSWSTETVDTAQFVGERCHLDVYNNTIYFSYYDAYTNRLKVAIKDATSTSFYFPDQIHSDTGEFSDLVVTTAGVPVVAYYNNGGNDLWCAHFKNNNWILEKVDSGTARVGKYLSLAADVSSLFLAYHDSITEQLKMAKRPLP